MDLGALEPFGFGAIWGCGGCGAVGRATCEGLGAFGGFAQLVLLVFNLTAPFVCHVKLVVPHLAAWLAQSLENSARSRSMHVWPGLLTYLRAQDLENQGPSPGR